MSQNERMSMPSPKVTSDGKYVCDVDSQVFDNQDDYYSHCMRAHAQAAKAKTW